ncbi:MAG: CoA-binding protein [Acidobacteria bacterium]|nr:CoA-binding protein [Acidobacteriota bacterium]
MLIKAEKLKAIFAPRSVAVIGATARPQSLGRAVFANLLYAGYGGCAYPVNPGVKSVLGVRAYGSILEVPDDVDLAVIVVPAAAVCDTLEEAGRKGCRGSIVISAGFKEIGGEGGALERRLQEVARRHGIAVVGPNCFGVINTDPAVSLNATFSRSFPAAGRIAFVSQSGALGVAALEHAAQEKIGFSKFISIGNKADINENHVLAALADDEATDVILLYLEDLEDPKEFIDLARRVSEKKPILAVKSGRTKEGAKAAASHTGALAGSDETYDLLFTQCGVLRVETLEELFRLGMAFTHRPLPRGKRLAIVTNAGGPGIMATDAAVRHGLELARLNPATEARMRPHMSPAASLGNPVDLVGDADEARYREALAAVLDDDGVDEVIVIVVPQMNTDLGAMSRVVAGAARETDKPLFAVYMATGDIERPLRLLDEAGVLHYRFPEDAARALGAMAHYVRWRKRPHAGLRLFDDVRPDVVREILAGAARERRSFLPEPEAHAVLGAYGLPVSRSRFVRDGAEAAAAAREIGFPVVLKIVSPDIVHKVDVGGVRLDLNSEEEVRGAYAELTAQVAAAQPEARIWGVFVQEMVGRGKETILGMKRDPHFGPLLMFGLGGIYVEVFRDVIFRLAPIRELDARTMIRGIRGAKLLKGFRGEPASDMDAIADALLRLSQLVTDFAEIEEMDINPLIVLPEGNGARVVDARILIRK